MERDKRWAGGGLGGVSGLRNNLRRSDELRGREVYIVIFAIGSGGRTAAVLDQCEVFAELGMDPVIVTFDFQRDFETSVASSLNGRALPPRTSVVNLYEDLRRCEAVGGGPAQDPVVGVEQEHHTSASHTAGTRDFRTSFDEQGRCLSVRQTRNGLLERDVLYRDGVPYLIREYDSSGRCSKESSLDGAENAVSEERYYAMDGTCYLTRMLDPATKKQRGNFWHVRGEAESRRYGHNTPFHTAWLEDLLRRRTEGRTRPFVIGESASGVLKVLDLYPETADRLYMFHENHLASPHTLGSPIRSDYGAAPKRISEMPLLVVPTSQQAQDIRTQFGDEVHVRPIGNLVSDKRSGDPIEKIDGRVGCFGRLAPSKQVDRTLHVFRDVRARVPHARLEVFGDGPERGRLEALAQELKISESVTFHGRVANIGDEMARSAVMVSTTSTESFGLSIAESLAVGTPVVSYAVNYGPKDLIRDGENGYLVEPGDDEALADRVARLLEDPREARKLGARGERRMAREFSRASFSAAWQAAFLDVASDARQGRTAAS